MLCIQAKGPDLVVSRLEFVPPVEAGAGSGGVRPGVRGAADGDVRDAVPDDDRRGGVGKQEVRSDHLPDRKGPVMGDGAGGINDVRRIEGVHRIIEPMADGHVRRVAEFELGSRGAVDVELLVRIIPEVCTRAVEDISVGADGHPGSWRDAACGAGLEQDLAAHGRAAGGRVIDGNDDLRTAFVIGAVEAGEAPAGHDVVVGDDGFRGFGSPGSAPFQVRAARSRPGMLVEAAEDRLPCGVVVDVERGAVRRPGDDEACLVAAQGEDYVSTIICETSIAAKAALPSPNRCLVSNPKAT